MVYEIKINIRTLDGEVWKLKNKDHHGALQLPWRRLVLL
jgi:hypothetical protein